MKKLLVFLILLSSYSALASQAHLEDGVFTIRDVLTIINMFAGLAGGVFKSFVLFAFYIPSYIFVSALIDNSLGAFLEIPEYGFAISTYFSLAYWIGGFILLMKIDVAYPNRNIGLLFITFLFGPFILGVVGFFNEWWLNQELTLEFIRAAEFADCINNMENSLDCLALF